MRRLGWTMILAAGLAACGKKEPPPAPSDLSRPEKTSPSGALSGTPEQLPAEAEVTASSGPVQLTLRIYKTKLKAKKEFYEPFDPANSLLYQLELKNMGKKPLVVTDKIFKEPWNTGSPLSGIKLEVLGPDGKSCFGSGFHDWSAPTHGSLGVPKAKGDRSPQIRSTDEVDSPPRLRPGESITTTAWVHQHEPDLILGMPKRKPIGQFTEVHLIDTTKPGTYRVRAIYNHELEEEFLQRYDFVRVRESNVRCATPFVEFEVLP